MGWEEGGVVVVDWLICLQMLTCCSTRDDFRWVSLLDISPPILRSTSLISNINSFTSGLGALRLVYRSRSTPS